MIGKRHLVQKIQRDVVKVVLGRMLKWSPPAEEREGHTVILGTPWMLRELLPVNLRFIQRMDNSQLDRLNIVFDRPPQPGGDAFIDEVKQRFPDLPLHFQFHPVRAGKLIQRVNRSKFYASTNWFLGLNATRTRYAVLHDFDLYPYTRDFFVGIVDTMRENNLRFSGAEHTHFDGLGDDDSLIGTWELGVDARWLRETYSPVQCFHAVTKVNNRWVDLDAFSAIQSRTPERRLAEGAGDENFAHVKNLCSMYLLYAEGKPAKIAWRLHFLWYLRSLEVGEESLDEAIASMSTATDANLDVQGRQVDFSNIHRSCADVLRRELAPMEQALYGRMRPKIDEFIVTFDGFLSKFGDNSPLAPPVEPAA